MLSQAASDAVIVSLRGSLNWADTVTWPIRLMARSVWVQEVAGSNPASPTHMTRSAQ